MSTYSVGAFPPKENLETVNVLRALVTAHRHLAELKGIARTIPNEGLLVSTLSLQEAQSSSEIENIITTQDSLFRYQIQPSNIDPVSKEVAYYSKALTTGFQEVRSSGLLTLNTMLSVQAVIEGNNAGFRRLPGTMLRNERTQEVVFEPPPPEDILPLMAELEGFIHEPSTLDPLTKMALVHHQFETIHPFYDGNGRSGRILNILSLVQEGLLDVPILYLSRYISHNKLRYYQLLQSVRETGEWEPWILYMLTGVAKTAAHTTALVLRIGELLQKTKKQIRHNYKFYSQDLINNIFRHPYTKVAFLEQDLDVSRPTATRYLEALSQGGVLTKHRLGRENYYVNAPLVELLFNLPDFD